MKFLHRKSARLAALACACFATLSSFAEGAASQLPEGLDATLLTNYKDNVILNLKNVLVGFAVITVVFFVWGIMKKALNRSK